MARIFLTIALIFFVVYTSSAFGQGSKVCPPNSEARLCGRMCEPTCQKPQELICDPANPSSCKIECRCNRGFVRNRRTGQCVRLNECFQKQYNNDVPPGGVPDMFGPDNSLDNWLY